MCGEFPCLNGGSCTPNGTVNYTCTCPPGVEGDNCEEDTYDGCRSNPCQNDGNCTVRIVTHTHTHKQVYTQQGVARWPCGIRLYMKASPHRAATFMFTQDSVPGKMYTCNCPFGFGDDNCTTDTVDSCLSNPCTIEEICTVRTCNYMYLVNVYKEILIIHVGRYTVATIYSYKEECVLLCGPHFTEEVYVIG